MAVRVVGGANDKDTAVEVSKEGWSGGANTIVIAADGLADPPPMIVTEKKWMDFHWPVPMSIGENDSDGAAYRNLEPRASTGETTAIRQLQRRLKDLGYGWDPISFDWTYYYGGYSGDRWYKNYPPTGNGVDPYPPDLVFTNTEWMKGDIGRWRGNWYMCLRYWPPGTPGRIDHATIGGSTYSHHSIYEIELQKRIDTYPGELDGLWMGSPDGSIRYDGRYGSGPLTAVRIFNEMCGEGDDMQGRWVGPITKRNLEKGLVVNGDYDIPTRVAVWLFQANQRKNGNPYNIQREDGVVDTATMNALEYETTVQVEIPRPPEQGAPDLLVAVPLAALNNAPLFPVSGNSLYSPIKSEINRLGANKCIIVGGTSSVSSGIENELRGMGLTVDRIGGDSRYEVSANVAARFPSGRGCIVLNGTNHVQSYGVTGYAAYKKWPILLVSENSAISAVRSQLSRFNQTYVVGTTRMISNTVMNYCNDPKRLSGPDRHRNAISLNNYANFVPENGIYLSTDELVTDHYCGSVLAGIRGCPMLVYSGRGFYKDGQAKLPSTLAHYVENREVDDFTIIGRTSNSTIQSFLNAASVGDLDVYLNGVVFQPVVLFK